MILFIMAPTGTLNPKPLSPLKEFGVEQELPKIRAGALLRV